ncbi:MAG: hypothetical protein Q9186_001678 [Xanthomendoza sp. 1 TL-2023]
MMDLLQHLEELAMGLDKIEEPTISDLTKWQKLFGYTASEAHQVITRLRSDVNGQKLSEEQWNLLKSGKEAEGHDRETYGHQLELWSTSLSSRSRSRPSTNSRDNSSYIFKLGGPLVNIENVRRVCGVSAQVRKGYGEEGNTDFASVDGAAKHVIEKWLEMQSPAITYRPTFIRLSQAPKDLSNTSSYPTLGIDSTLPQHRMHDLGQVPAPAQNEYPVWYFFYGTLMDPEVLQGCLGIPDRPTMTPASIQGGTLRTWGRKYKALVDGPDEAQVNGYAFCVQSAEQEEYLRFRETEAYEVVRCRIVLSSESEIASEAQGLTFRFARVDELDVGLAMSKVYTSSCKKALLGEDSNIHERFDG